MWIYLLVVFWQSIKSKVSRQTNESPPEREGTMEAKIFSILFLILKLNASRLFFLIQQLPAEEVCPVMTLTTNNLYQICNIDPHHFVHKLLN